MRILLIDDSAAYRDEFATLLFDARIKHSVLDYSEDCELLEIIMPADFATVELE